MRLRLLLGLSLLAGLAGWLWSASRPVTLEVLQLAHQPLEHWVVASGQVRAQSLAKLGAQITGTVLQRHVREGEQVKADQLLISLEDSEQQAQLQQAQAALDQLHNQLYPQAVQSLHEARLAWQQASREAKRRRQLAQEDMLAAEQAEQAEYQVQSRLAALKRAELAERALKPGGEEERLLEQRLAQAQSALAKTQIRAPFAGSVQSRNVEPGDQVQPGRVLLEVARLDGLEVVAAVDEKYMAPLAAGQKAVVIADAWPAQELAARLSYLAPAVDEAAGTLDVHLEVTDPQQLLRQGMTVSVSLLAASKESTLSVPRDYLHNQQVFRLRDGQIETVPVSIGLQSATRVELSSGVAAGDLLILPEQRPATDTKVRAGQVVQP